MALRFNNLDDAIDTAINALEWIRENATIEIVNKLFFAKY